MGMSDEALLNRLNGHPELRSRVELMLLVVDNEANGARIETWREGKKTPMAQHIWRNSRRRSAVPAWEQAYPRALASNLPIGSGEIESAHRYIVQKRLKLPGSWWCAANAEHMLALRLNRANRQWDNYWNQVRKVA